MSTKINRRDALRLSGAASVGGFGLWAGRSVAAWDPANPPPGLAETNTLFKSLAPFRLGEPVAMDEMRVTFMGTSPLERKAQMATSVFVELGNGDSFVFDAGMGCQVNYTAMQVPASKMRRIFLTHLHGDHTSDLTYIYAFGPQRDGKSPLYLWGPSKSYVRNPWFGKREYPEEPEYFDDGMIEFAKHFREMNRWHTESQSFVGTRWVGAEGDGYDIFATELNWATGLDSVYWSNNAELRSNFSHAWKSTTRWVAYEANGVRISFFPAVHDRNGSVSYKLEWNGMSLIFSGDTKPNSFMLNALTEGSAGVDLLIHETVIPAEVWASLATGGGTPSPDSLLVSRTVQENSHTPEPALGYILAQAQNANKPPRLAVATHFQATDSTIRPALAAIRSKYAGPVSIATDLMVVNVSRSRILQRRAVVSDYSPTPPIVDKRAPYSFTPKYNDPRTDPNLNPYAPYGPLEQFSPFLTDSVLPACSWDPTGFQCTHPYSAYNPPPNPPGVGASRLKSSRK
jgi:ribonuclease Z